MPIPALAHTIAGLALPIALATGPSATSAYPGAALFPALVTRPAANQATLLYNFLGPPDARLPLSSVVEVQGKFYGSAGGGSDNSGAFFRIERSGGVFRDSILYSFTGGVDGNYPFGEIAAGPNGTFFGATEGGGPGADGAIYEISPNGKRYQETVIATGGGGSPNGVMLDASGTLYGTTVDGGGSGDVFKLTPSGSGFTQTILYYFRGDADGGAPRANVIEDANGALYGTTMNGGTYGAGTIFKLTPTASGYLEQVIHALRGRDDGANPTAPLTFGKNGKLFGTTYYGGGPANLGSVIELKLDAHGYSERVIYSFQGGQDGEYPFAGLTLGHHGILYGTTAGGGAYNQGTIFALTPLAGGGYAESVVHTFQGYPNDGGTPDSALLAVKDAFYSLTSTGGVCCGTFFEFTP
jgi:uncharacterized repeat protein (TIGR03803 family)